MRWLLQSATNAYDPSGEMKTPSGELNLALVPTPSVEPLVPAKPAKVVTDDVEMMI